MAEATGLALDTDDLVEVTHRLNAFLHALAAIRALPLATVEPVPLPPADA
ncbi:MAG: hypothetical protein HYU41_05365 [Candidatus Rokubacteria bacterium]|nr:hypothetical protein [Candidatus Rokubacteria bacterium]